MKASSAILVNLHVGMWTGRRKDKEATAQVIKDAGANAPDAASVNKHPISKTALAPIVTAMGMVRDHFYKNSLPWKDNGDRVVSRKCALEFVEGHELAVKNFNETVDHFVNTVYLSEMEGGHFRMGTMFNPDEWPTQKQVRKKYYVSMDMDAVPDALDFRLKTNDAAFQARVNGAMKDLWERVYEPIEALHKQLADEKAKLFIPTFNNVKEIIALIPKLNFTDDPELEALHERCSKQMALWEPKDFKTDTAARAAAAREANTVLQDMSGFMNAFKGVNLDED
jgi:hypothetical protein